MADQVVLSPFLGVVFDNLISFAKSEIGLVLGVNKEMAKLSETLSTIRAVLNDAEEKQVTNEAIRKWLSELKDTAYDADDVLDECAFEGLQLASEMRKNGIRKQLTCFPEGIKHALMLQALSVQSCSKDLMDLPDWIGSLTSLQALWIDGCQKRKVMPEGLQNLTYLQILQIRGCSSGLEKRCEKEMGEDWCKISHIPQVLVSSAPPE